MDCEIEFLPVGDASKAGDAIVLRYGNVNSYELMIVDGGNVDSGKMLVEHVRKYFGNNAIISHVVLTHSDNDHASGLRTVIEELTVRNLWLHVPWMSAETSLPYFSNKNWTVDGLQKAILKEYDLIAEIVQLAINKNIPVYFPYAGQQIGPFQVLSPHKDVYTLLMPQFDRTPDPDQAAIEAAGFWIGKASTNVWSQLLEKAAAKVQKWITESWDNERLKDGGVSSASNESSVVLYGDFGVGRRILLTGDAGTHNISILVASCARYEPVFKELGKYDFLTGYAVSLRYPDDFYMPEVDEAREALAAAKEVRAFVAGLMA